MEYLIDLADCLRQKRDLNTFMCIFRAIEHCAVSSDVNNRRLEHFRSISSQSSPTLQRLCNPLAGPVTPPLDHFLRGLQDIKSSPLSPDLVDIQYLRSGQTKVRATNDSICTSCAIQIHSSLGSKFVCRATIHATEKSRVYTRPRLRI